MVIGCLRLSDVNVIDAVLSTRVRRRRKFGEVSCTECTFHVNDFELILTVTMKTRNPLDVYFGSEFLTICNHCRVLAAWSRKTLKVCEKFSHLLEKRPLTVKFLKLCSESFHRDIDRRVLFKFCEIWQTENRWNCALLTWQNNFPWLSSCRYCADRVQNLPGPAPDNVLRVLKMQRCGRSLLHNWKQPVYTLCIQLYINQDHKDQ